MQTSKLSCLPRSTLFSQEQQLPDVSSALRENQESPLAYDSYVREPLLVESSLEQPPRGAYAVEGMPHSMRNFSECIPITESTIKTKAQDLVREVIADHKQQAMQQTEFIHIFDETETQLTTEVSLKAARHLLMSEEQITGIRHKYTRLQQQHEGFVAQMRAAFDTCENVFGGQSQEQLNQPTLFTGDTASGRSDLQEMLMQTRQIVEKNKESAKILTRATEDITQLQSVVEKVTLQLKCALESQQQKEMLLDAELNTIKAALEDYKTYKRETESSIKVLEQELRCKTLCNKELEAKQINLEALLKFKTEESKDHAQVCSDLKIQLEATTEKLAQQALQIEQLTEENSKIVKNKSDREQKFIAKVLELKQTVSNQNLYISKHDASSKIASRKSAMRISELEAENRRLQLALQSRPPINQQLQPKSPIPASPQPSIPRHTTPTAQNPFLESSKPQPGLAPLIPHAPSTPAPKPPLHQQPPASTGHKSSPAPACTTPSPPLPTPSQPACSQPTDSPAPTTPQQPQQPTLPRPQAPPLNTPAHPAAANNP